MLGRLSTSVAVASLVFIAVGWSSIASAATKPAGYVILTSGPFIAIQADRSSRSLTRGSEFYQGDRLWTGPSTKAQVRFSDGAIMTLRPNTEFSVDEYEFDTENAGRNKSLFTLIKGGFRTLTGLISRLHPDGYKVKTVYAIVGVRGTTYETVIDSGLYAAAWQGTISVTNEQQELLLGFGQEYNFAQVSSPTSAPTGLLQVPPQFQETIDPGLQEALVDPTQTRLTTGLLQDGVDARLTAAELASLDRAGFAAIRGTTFAPMLGGANDLASSSNPILFDGSADQVLRQGSASLVGFTTDTSLAGFPVTWGQWDGGVIQPDANDASQILPVTSPVFWMTLFPATSVAIATGSVSYNNVLQISGAGTGGAVNPLFSSFDATLNFASGALTGTMVVDNTDVWNVDFTGSLSGAQFSANADATSTFNGTAGVTGSLAGSLTGNASGFGAKAPLGMGGVFDFAFDFGTPTPTDDVDVAGTFLARHDGRFFAGEQATLLASAQTGFAAFGGSGRAPFSGQTTDGAGGSPILFDSTAGPNGTVLRQDGAPARNVRTNTALAGFPVSFGEWDGGTSPAALLDNPDGIINPVGNSVFWMTLLPATSIPTAAVSVSYDTVLDFNGNGTGGAVTALSLDGTLDFGTGALNGNMQITNADTWDVNFTGGISGAQFSANADATSTFNGTAGVTGSLAGSLTGNASGFGAKAPLGMGGVFDFAFDFGTPTPTDDVDVAGTFLARHDARFLASDPTLDRSGVAVFGVPSSTLLGGSASDGSAGAPIIFDTVADVVLRRNVAVGTDIVTTDNTFTASGFPVSFGVWDTPISPADVLPDRDGNVVLSANDPVFWITALPGAIPSAGTGTYQTVLAFQGAGEAGAVSALAINATVDFGTAGVAGSMQVQNGARPPSGFSDQWNVNFAGNISGPAVNATVTSGTVSVNAVVQTNVTGALSGTLTGPPTTVVGRSGPDGMAGAFDLRQGATNFVQGTFFARQ